MPAISHVVRRGAFYYWRQRLPSALAESRNSATLVRVEIEKTIADILESRAKAPVDAIDRAATTPVAAPFAASEIVVPPEPAKETAEAPETKMRPRRRQTLRPRRRRVPPRRRERSH